ncbi:MAG: zinc-ribbon domain-containing protein [Lachnospira sp.]
MFCNKCGTEISDDSKFCPKCGCALTGIFVQENQNTVVVAENSGFATRNIEMSHTAINAVLQKTGIKETAYQSRVESTEDKELNDKLFTLYNKLIEPLVVMENKMDLIQNAQEDLSQKTILRIPFKVGYFSLFILNLIWSTLADETGNLYDILIVRPFYGRISSLINEFWGIMVLFFVVPFLILLIINIILRLLQPLIDKRRYQRDKEIIKSCTDIVGRIEAVIEPYVAFIPPEFRYSEAVSFFCKSYNNSIVDNLKEAVNEYVKYKHHNEILDTISQSARMVVSQLQHIKQQNDTMITQMEKINASIWEAGFIFRW